MTAQSLDNRARKLGIWTVIISIVSVLSLLSVTLTTFAWGTGDTTMLFLLLYPALILSTILIVAKRRLGFILTLGIAICYAILFIKHIGKYFVFDVDNTVLLLVLVLPFLTIVALIPLTTAFLFAGHKKRKAITATSITVALCIPLFSIAERADMDYMDSVFAEFTIDNNNMVAITCKPQPSDTRTFFLTSTSTELADVVKKEGTYLIDQYYVANTIIEKNYRFRRLQSLTIKRLENKDLGQPLTWKAEEIRGDISFLKP